MSGPGFRRCSVSYFVSAALHRLFRVTCTRATLFCAYLMYGCYSSLCVSCSLSATVLMFVSCSVSATFQCSFHVLCQLPFSVCFMFSVSYFSEFVLCSVSATFECWFHVLCRLLFSVCFMFSVSYLSVFMFSVSYL